MCTLTRIFVSGVMRYARNAWLTSVKPKSEAPIGALLFRWLFKHYVSQVFANVLTGSDSCQDLPLQAILGFR